MQSFLDKLPQLYIMIFVICRRNKKKTFHYLNKIYYYTKSQILKDVYLLKIMFFKLNLQKYILIKIL